MDIGEISAGCNALASRFFDIAQEGVFESFAQTGFAATVRAVEEDDLLGEVERLGCSKASKRTECQMSKFRPRPCAEISLSSCDRSNVCGMLQFSTNQFN
ncbi:hypothetical protein D3C86_1895030 [compost metagenome]